MAWYGVVTIYLKRYDDELKSHWMSRHISLKSISFNRRRDLILGILTSMKMKKN